MDKLLLATIFLPLFGVGVVWAFAPSGRKAVRAGALVVSLLTLAGAVWLAAEFPSGAASGDRQAADKFAVTELAWLGESSAIDVRFSVGLDGIGLWLFGLSALLTVTAVLVSWNAIEERPAEFYGLLLLLETGMLGVFTARDILLFYVFFEFTLIPLFFLIGVWGSEDRRHAAIKFFLFTLAGSVLTLLGLLAVVLWVHRDMGLGTMTFSIPALSEYVRLHPMPVNLQTAIFLALFAGFAIKVPLFPLHTWLPLAHVQAPTAGSVILAGILLKIGAYGFLRFNLPMLPDATATLMPCMLWLSAAGIVYGALVALAQSDMKRLIAYSSVSHLGFCTLGLFALNRLGIQGGMLQMINHGLSTGGLFALVGMVYERYHTRQIGELGGLAKRTPRLAAMMVLFAMSSIGLPGLNGFTGEIMVLVGMFQRGWFAAPDVGGAEMAAAAAAGDALAWQLKTISVIAVSGVVMGAWYMLWLVQRVFFGPLREPHQERIAPDDAPGATGPMRDATHDSADCKANEHSVVHDLTFREGAALAPLIVFILWIGVQPSFFLARMGGRLDDITQQVDATYERHRRERADREFAEHVPPHVSQGGLTRVN